MIDALRLARDSREAIYDTIFFAHHEKFQYPLTSLLWLDGLGAVLHVDVETLNRLNALVFAANAVCCGLIMRKAFTTLDFAYGASANWGVFIVGCAVPYVFWPTLYGLYVGQIQIWIDLLFSLALLAWWREARLLAGVAIGLACTIKPQLGLLLIWGLLWRERRFSVALATTAACFGALAMIRYGAQNNFKYMQVLSFISRHGESFHPNQSINGLTNRLLFLGNNLDWAGDRFAPFSRTVWLATWISNLALAAIPLGMALRARDQRPGVLDLALGGLCFTMASPIVWEHHYGLALPICLLVFGASFDQRVNSRGRTLLACAWVAWLLIGADLQLFDSLSGTLLNVLQSPVLFGALILVAALCALAPSLRTQQSERREALGDSRLFAALSGAPPRTGEQA